MSEDEECQKDVKRMSTFGGSICPLSEVVYVHFRRERKKRFEKVQNVDERNFESRFNGESHV